LIKRYCLIIVVCSLVLSGCWDRIEVNDVAIVTAAAIDKSKDKEIELSVQVFIPRSLNGGSGIQGSGQKSLSLVRSAKGVTIADAMSRIQMEIPRMIFWGHCKVYIYGEDLAKEGISDLVDYLARHPVPRNRAFMYVSKGKAAEVLKAVSELERDSAETVRALSGLHVGMAVTLVDLMQMLMSPAKAAILPMIGLMPMPSTPPGGENPYLFGSAILKSGKLVGQLTERATRGAMWVRNEITSSTVTVKAKNVKGFVSLNPIREVTELIPVIEEGKWKMVVKVSTEGDLIQNGSNLDLSNPELLRIMQVALRKDIEARMRGTIHLLQHDMKADIFGFATQFHRKYPKEFAKVKDRWGEVFASLDVDLQVASSIRRPGLVTIPGGIPEAEVRQK